MSLRRMLFNWRLKKPLMALGVSILLLSIALLYYALMSEDSFGSGTFSLPRENRRSFRFQSKMDPGINGNDGWLMHNANELLLQEELQSVRERDLLSMEAKEAATNFLSQLYPKKWKTATETDEMALELKHFLADFGLGATLTCRDIDQMKLGSPISFSRTKTVDSIFKDDASHSGNSYDQGYNGGMGVLITEPAMALKTFSGDSDTKIACMKEIYDPEYCEVMGNYRLLREILLLSTLHHPSVIEMKGCCLRGNRMSQRSQDKGILLVTESGSPLSQSITQSSHWSQQLWMALQITRLLIYLDRSPLGSLRFNKLDLKDFVLVNNKDVKLADLDDLELGEKSCSSASDCKHTGKHFPCEKGHCVGLNAYINMNIAIMNVLSLILTRPPPGNEGAATDFVNRLNKLDFDSTSAIAAEIQELLKKACILNKSGSGAYSIIRTFSIFLNISLFHYVLLLFNFLQQGEQQDSREGAGVAFSTSALSQFDRYNRTNFPGIFDYPCSGSRVTWGCFHTVSSLNEVATMCISDPRCQCFITFSTKPESESLMTIVMKNASGLESSRSSSGTTLFVRRSDFISKEEDPLKQWEDVGRGLNSRDKHKEEGANDVMPVVGRGPEHRVDESFIETNSNDHAAEYNGGDGKGDDGDSKSFTEIIQCLDGLGQTLASAYSTREKRLMTHLGLKGTKEQEWRQLAQHQPLEEYTRLMKTGGGGGRFTINLTLNAEAGAKQVTRRATFIAANGPGVYHTAYAVVYHLDRILGLYHTPPCVVIELSKELVKEYQRDAVWHDIFSQLVSSDGTLTGILVPRTPKIIKVSRMVLEPLEVMVSEVIPFEKQDKLQLEYALLWWLARMQKKNDDHLGYKGFLSLLYHITLSDNSILCAGYLNHCQFPNVVYRALNCFRCEGKERGNENSEVCSLGEEVALRATTMFPNELELNLHQMQEDDIILSIDSAATAILRLVNKCIQTFDRHTVLY
ncbi:hypothetical protein EGW08_014690 [Elysia chlorotica]|uniref:Protein kinase domain-containing protein n=1 Tax=Elysia chlorotica TaxID=188477 RepID=A0A433T7J5_ELYCH|nr:hypothetical protein EGW08_014690 [Elysia chlorotica]